MAFADTLANQKLIDGVGAQRLSTAAKVLGNGSFVNEVLDRQITATLTESGSQEKEFAQRDQVAPSPAAHSDAPGLGYALFRFAKEAVQHPEMVVAYLQAKIKGQVDTSGVPDVTPSPGENARTSGRSPTERIPDKFGDATDQARTCIKSGDLACAHAKIAEARKFMSPEDLAGDRETISAIEHNLDSAQWEAKRKAYEKDKEARQALQTEERISAEKEVEAKRIATQVTPAISNVATPTARPRETQDPDAARSIEFIEAQEKRRLKAVFDRADLMDKVAAEEDKDKQAALRRRYDAVTRAEEEEQAASRRRFERASVLRRKYWNLIAIHLSLLLQGRDYANCSASDDDDRTADATGGVGQWASRSSAPRATRQDCVACSRWQDGHTDRC